MELVFKTIDVERDAALCIAWRADSYQASFGTDAMFWEESGADGSRYLTWLRKRIAEMPDGCVHAWHGEQIVGQLDARLRPDTPKQGYVNLYYVAPEARGMGVADQLDAYITQAFRKRGMTYMRLSVSPTNERALGFYRRCGWVDIGPRPGKEHLHLMEKQLTGGEEYHGNN